MFKRFIAKVREVLYKMNLIKGIKKLSDTKDVYMNEEMYNAIEKWNCLYKGYFEEIHKVFYHTIDGKKTRTMHSLNMPKVISEEMASLVYNEKCEISISDESLSDFIKEVFKNNKFDKNFQDYLEYNFALGGMVIKPYVKDNQIKLSFVTADCFIPLSWDNKGVYEGVFINQFVKNNKYYTHLEWHTWEADTLIIQNTLHVSDTKGELGVDITGRFDDFFPGVAIKAVFPIKKEKKANSFVYFKPNIANNIDTQSPLGISLFANAVDTLKTIDTQFDSFNREFRLGKKRIIVPAQMVKTTVDPNTQEIHRYFDPEDETYEAFKFGDPEESPVKDIKVELRVDEHISAINANLNYLAMQTGFSAGTFTFDGQSMKTATEVVSEQSKTFKSKKSHETIIEAGIHELIESIVQIAEQYKIYTAPENIEVTVAFDDSVAEDKNAEIAKQIQMINNKLNSRKRAIMKIHGLGETEAEELLAEINEENKTATAEEMDFFGTGGGK
ncbi:phage portal protein [Virgibacillus sp. AGTR]|uniref:phage portal protein n=1 Tax=Virgibacillus sp. AGTR TaxID=2812055 RepID=UPI001D160243|nr:phage portal protein [Virgibacillus sp. AGTR]MCC2250071.1 phage portal protein [Virgibacillus sp. AGTR]